jgi:hypothetical protein
MSSEQDGNRLVVAAGWEDASRRQGKTQKSKGESSGWAEFQSKIQNR